MSDLADLCARAVTAAEGDEDVEAFAEESRTTRVRAREGEVESLTFAETRGVGVRVVTGHRVGYAYAAHPTSEDVVALVRSAAESARFTEPDEANVLPVLAEVEPLPDLYRPAQTRAETARKVDLALDLERAATTANPEVRRVESADYADAVSRVAISSTLGGPLQYERTDCWASVTALARRDDETQTGFSFRMGREIDGVEWEAAAEEAAERGARLLGGRKPSTERVPVVFDPMTAGGFLSVLAGGLSAESVLKGRSPLAGREGTAVAGDLVTLVDDGRLVEGPAAAPFDDEGVRTGRTPLIDRGVLTGFLHNTYTAARAGTRSTGNAGRGSYRAAPGVSPSNLYLEPGHLSVDQLLSRAERAVYVQEVTGLHSGANPISGEFSVGAVGLRVEGGMLGQPLREMTIASTLLDVLANVAAIGSDLRFLPWGGGLGAPSILVGEMTVAGT